MVDALHRWKYPAETRPDSLREVAQVHSPAAAEAGAVPATEGASIHQSVHPDPGQADRWALIRIECLTNPPLPLCAMCQLNCAIRSVKGLDSLIIQRKIVGF